MRAPAWLWLAICACSFVHGSASGTAGDAATPPGDGSGSAGNGFRKAIAVQRNMVAGDVTGFPVWVDLANDFDLAAHSRADHGDVYFADGSGAPIAYEITAWDHSTGSLQAWVRAAHLTPSMINPDPNVFYVYFGGTAAAQASNGAAVFDNGFAAVWHLDGTTVSDATGMVPGAIAGVAPAPAGGMLGSALAFSDATTAITFVNPITGGGASTISAWVNETARAPGVYAYAVVILGTASQDEARWLYSLYGGDGNSVAAGLFSDDHAPTPHVIATGSWVKLDWVLDAGHASHLYVNGMQIDMNGLGAPSTMGTTGVIGNAPNPISDYSGGNGTMAFFGMLDEVRLAGTARSANWLLTEYNNQSKPTSFYVVGMLEAL